jgi:hypothetical protein
MSARQSFLDLIKNCEPGLIFRGKTQADFVRRQKAFRKAFMRCLRRLPREAPLEPEALWSIEEDGPARMKACLDTASFSLDCS